MVDVERSKLESGLTLLWLLRATTARTRVSWWNPTDLQECCRPPWSLFQSAEVRSRQAAASTQQKWREESPRPKAFSLESSLPGRQRDLDRPLPPVRPLKLSKPLAYFPLSSDILQDDRKLRVVLTGP
jgi:hypothetical protein